MSNPLDDAIRQSLSNEDRKLYDELESDMNIPELMLTSIQGRNRGIKVFAIIMSFLFTILAGYCVWRFVHTEDVRSAMNWMMAFSAAFLSIAMFKMYFWMEMNKVALMREMKRLELQLSVWTEQQKS